MDLVILFDRSLMKRVGNAWLQRIVSLIHADCDVTTANSKPLDEHVIYIDLEGLDSVLKQREPRIIKSHFNYRKIASTFRQGKGKVKMRTNLNFFFIILPSPNHDH